LEDSAQDEFEEFAGCYMSTLLKSRAEKSPLGKTGLKRIKRSRCRLNLAT
jgi:hypothetical protein